jgi:hypothetical protein
MIKGNVISALVSISCAVELQILRLEQTSLGVGT